MSVPKCKECEYHWKFQSRRNKNVYPWTRAVHFCKKVIIPQKDRADEYSYISSGEFKTSPKWCPKRV